MNIINIIFLLVLFKAKLVFSDCDTYVKCVGSYFDTFFDVPDEYDSNVNTSVAVPDFENVKLDSVNLYNILHSVSEFLKDEITSGFQYGPPVNIFSTPNNVTNIYVRTIVINDFDNVEQNNDVEDVIQGLNFTVPYLESSAIKIVSNKANDNFKDEKRNISYLEIDDYNKEIRENEIPDTEFDSINELDDNSTDYPIIDYIELYKDTTNEYIDINVETTTKGNIATSVGIYENATNNSGDIENDWTKARNISQVLFPWVAAVFIKNDTSDQFDYYCDGAVVSTNVIVTAARCIQYYGKWANSENLIVLLGKTSLRTINENEVAVKIKQTIIHENFTTGVENDIAILVTETAFEVQAGFSEGDFDEAYTTGWAVSGELTLVPFDIKKNVTCKDFQHNQTFCTTYDNDIAVCPSYGGIFAVRQANAWFLRGIRYGDPTDRSFCTTHNIMFTDLTYYLGWINMYTQ